MTEQELQKLIQKYLAGKATPEEIKLLDTLDALFERSPEIIIPDSQKQAIGERILNRISAIKQVPPELAAPVRHLWVRRMSVAAAVILLIIVGSIFFRNYNRKGMRRPEELAEVITGTGQQKKISLPDGSVIILNAGSRVTFPTQFSDTARTVTLEGEAFFTIQKDEKRPFLVTSGPITTRVLGTSFNVYAYRPASLLKIAVATGKVQVNNQAEVLATLTSGKEIIYHKMDGQAEQLTLDSAFVGDWQTGRLIFRQAPMEEIINALYNKFGVTIRIDDKKIRAYRITTQFEHNTSLKEMLDIITTLNGTHYKMIGKDQVLIH